MIKKTCSTLFLLWLLLCFYPTSAQASDADYQQGLKALAESKYPEAMHYLELAVESDPNNARYANDYRQAAIRGKDFERSVNFFQQEVAKHPQSANLHLNFGFAYVDKIPVAGSITQVILANNALTEFTKAIELDPSWIGYYTRGESYLFWPKIFNRAPMGVADLEKAMEMQKKGPRRSYHVKAYIGLGDAYWKTDQLGKAKAVWQAGLKEFPDNPDLKARLSHEGDELKNLIEAGFDPAKRVNTDMSELWAQK
jgi:tetratricopeptide (TPR) repeat protein